MLTELRAALKIVNEQARRKKEYDKLVGADLDYKIIKDLINSATHGVVIELLIGGKDRLVIRREEAFDQLEKMRREAW